MQANLLISEQRNGLRAALADMRCPARGQQSAAPGHVPFRSPAGRRATWSYYVSQRGRRTLRQSDEGQRVWLSGITESVVLEPHDDPR
jgi:hypothetical protein